MQKILVLCLLLLFAGGLVLAMRPKLSQPVPASPVAIELTSNKPKAENLDREQWEREKLIAEIRLIEWQTQQIQLQTEKTKAETEKIRQEIRLLQAQP